MKKIFFALTTMSLIFTACKSDDDESENPAVDPAVEGLFVVNNGNFGAGNASLSFYDCATGEVENEVFQRANGYKLGDVAQSMTINGSTGWIAVNNSGVIYAIDIDTYKEKGRVTSIASPRDIFFVNDSKAYVTQLYNNKIAILDPKTYTVTGSIDIEGMDVATGSTEHVVAIGNYAYVNCWSYQKEILKIDMATDKVVARLEVGIQPCSIAADKNGYLWVLTDGGGWEQNPVGYEAPALCRVNVDKMEIDRRFEISKGESVSSLQVNKEGDTLYWLNGGVMAMNVNATQAPSAPAISTSVPYINAMTISPQNGDIYVADAADYQQAGTIYRYTSTGTQVGSFQVGIIPAAFCWK